VTGTSSAFQHLARELQAFLLQFQSGSEPGSASGSAPATGASAIKTSAAAPPPDEGGDTDGTSGTTRAQGRRHHHVGTEETGSPDSSLSLASAGTSSPIRTAGGATPSGLGGGQSLLAALQAYVATNRQNSPQSTQTQVV